MDIHGKGLLTPVQRRFIDLFARLPDQQQFYLAGGTALAEYYLGHRLSYDLDFFTAEGSLVVPVSYQIEQSGQSHGLGIEVVRRFATYAEFLVTFEAEQLKVDLALDAPFRFESPLLSEHNVLINDRRDLEIDKLLAYYGRAEPRDAVDLYFILEHHSLEHLLWLASQKDPGFDTYWFAIALNRAASFPDELERWPVKMLQPLEPVVLKRQFQQIAIDLLAGDVGL